MRAPAVVTALALLLGGSSLGALSADDAARYVMHAAEGGFIRLDTRTGAVSLCSRSDSQWSCHPVSDSASPAAEDVDRLRSENRELRAEIVRLEEMLLSGDKRSGGASRSSRLQLPSEEDVDKALNYLERMFRKFRDKFKDFEQQERRETPL